MSEEFCFVIMSFSDELKGVYENAIKIAVERQGLKCIRVDEIEGSGNIVRRIVECANDVKVIIADLTEQRPNVFYELGMSHTLGNNVIILAQNIEDVPFDIANYKVILYTNNIAGGKRLEREIESAIATLDEWSKKPSNPVQDFLPPEARPVTSSEHETVKQDLEKQLSVAEMKLAEYQGQIQTLEEDYLRSLAPDGMALIPAGEFLMGSNHGRDSEKPVHSVHVDAFYMDVYPVTNAQFKTFIDSNPQWGKDQILRQYCDSDYLSDWNGTDYPSEKANHPVIYVSWYAAAAYAQWVGKRLPTEAEWEKAARGGLEGKKYPWGDDIDESKANYGLNIGSTTAVDCYLPNGYGLYDMTGNIWEWVMDEWNPNFYSESLKENPVSGGIISFEANGFTNVKSPRVIRGGSWYYLPDRLRVAYRARFRPADANGDTGFRCVDL